MPGLVHNLPADVHRVSLCARRPALLRYLHDGLAGRQPGDQHQFVMHLGVLRVWQQRQQQTGSDDGEEGPRICPAALEQLLGLLEPVMHWLRAAEAAQGEPRQLGRLPALLLRPLAEACGLAAAGQRRPPCCSRCGRSKKQAGVSRFKVCAGCDTARYCNGDCHRGHWAQHRAPCLAVQQGRQDAAGAVKAVRRAARDAGAAADAVATTALAEVAAVAVSSQPCGFCLQLHATSFASTCLQCTQDHCAVLQSCQAAPFASHRGGAHWSTWCAQWR